MPIEVVTTLISVAGVVIATVVSYLTSQRQAKVVGAWGQSP